MNLRTDYQKLEHQRDKSQPLTARQQWKLTDLSYLKPFYKQGHKSVRGSGAVGGASRMSTEHESDDDPDHDHEPEPDDRAHEKQLYLKERDAYKNTSCELSHGSEKTQEKKRRENRKR